VSLTVWPSFYRRQPAAAQAQVVLLSSLVGGHHVELPRPTCVVVEQAHGQAAGPDLRSRPRPFGADVLRRSSASDSRDGPRRPSPLVRPLATSEQLWEALRLRGDAGAAQGPVPATSRPGPRGNPRQPARHQGSRLRRRRDPPPPRGRGATLSGAWIFTYLHAWALKRSQV